MVVGLVYSALMLWGMVKIGSLTWQSEYGR